jgi:hypothetical protein
MCEFSFFNNYRGFELAKIQNSVFGNISGTIGPLVFSSNQFGSHVYKKPSKSSTKKPSKSISINFNKSAPILWGNETLGEKAAWNSFAKNGFNNPRSKASKVYTGATCFKSCILSLQVLGQAYLPTGVTLDNFYSANPMPIDAFYYPAFAPSSMCTANLYSLNNFPVPITLGPCSFNNSGLSFLSFSWKRPTSQPQVGPTFSDPKGHRLGIALYCNGGAKFGYTQPTSYWRHLVFWSGFLAFPTTVLNTSTQMVMSVDLTDFASLVMHGLVLYKDFYWSFYVFSTDGTMSRIGGVVQAF